DEIDGPASDRGDRSIDIAVPGENDHRQLRLALLDRIEHLEAIHRASVKPYVEQHQTRPPFVDELERRIAVASRAALIAFVGQDPRYEFADVLFVVHHEDVERHFNRSP